MINIRVRREFMRIIFHVREGEVAFCFVADMGLEPFVHLVVLHAVQGELSPAPPEHDAGLVRAVDAFKARHGVSGEQYATAGPHMHASLPAALAAARVAPGPGIVAMRIASAMYAAKMPVTAALDLPATRAAMAAARACPDASSARSQLPGLTRALMDVSQGSSGQRREVRDGAGAGAGAGAGPGPGAGAGVHVGLRGHYAASLLVVPRGGVFYEFHLSDKMEPYAIACVLHPDRGPLTRLTRAQVADLAEALAQLRVRLGLQGETYHYTPLAEREATEAFVRGGGAAVRAKAHSRDFHLKIRVPTALCTTTIVALQLVDFAAVRTRIEPVQYQYARETLDWDQVHALLLADAI